MNDWPPGTVVSQAGGIHSSSQLASAFSTGEVQNRSVIEKIFMRTHQMGNGSGIPRIGRDKNQTNNAYLQRVLKPIEDLKRRLDCVEYVPLQASPGPFASARNPRNALLSRDVTRRVLCKQLARAFARLRGYFRVDPSSDLQDFPDPALVMPPRTAATTFRD